MPVTFWTPSPTRTESDSDVRTVQCVYPVTVLPDISRVAVLCLPMRAEAHTPGDMGVREPNNLLAPPEQASKPVRGSIPSAGGTYSTVVFRDIETTFFDPASVFLSTH